MTLNSGIIVNGGFLVRSFSTPRIPYKNSIINSISYGYKTVSLEEISLVVRQPTLQDIKQKELNKVSFDKFFQQKDKVKLRQKELKKAYKEYCFKFDIPEYDYLDEFIGKVKYQLNTYRIENNVLDKFFNNYNYSVVVSWILNSNNFETANFYLTLSKNNDLTNYIKLFKNFLIKAQTETDGNGDRFYSDDNCHWIESLINDLKERQSKISLKKKLEVNLTTKSKTKTIKI